MVALREVVDFYSGGTPSKSKPEFWQGDVPWFSAKDFKRPRLSDSSDHVAEAVFDSTPLRKLPAGTVAMVVRGMILAHTVPIAVLDVDAAVNQDVKALLPKRNLDPSFLAAMLRAQHSTILAQVGTAAHGTKKLDARVLESLEIPLPPLAEQRRVAAILDHSDALRAKRRQVVAHLDALSQSIFHDMFGQALATVPLSEAVEEFRYGTSNKSGVGGYPTLRIPNVIGGGIDTSKIKTVEVGHADLRRLTLRDDDLLFVRTNGNPDNVGRAAVFSGNAVGPAGFSNEPWIFASYLIRARLKLLFVPTFVAAYLATGAGRKQLRERAKTSAGQYNINTEALASIRIPDVPPEHQQVFAEIHSKVMTQRASVVGLAATHEDLFASLQARAFSGRL